MGAIPPTPSPFYFLLLARLPASPPSLYLLLYVLPYLLTMSSQKCIRSFICSVIATRYISCTEHLLTFRAIAMFVFWGIMLKAYKLWIRSLSLCLKVTLLTFNAIRSVLTIAACISILLNCKVEVANFINKSSSQCLITEQGKKETKLHKKKKNLEPALKNTNTKWYKTILTLCYKDKVLFRHTNMKGNPEIQQN